MNLKIKFNKEIHIYKGSQNFQEVSEYIKTAFKNLPSKFSLYYEDEDGDEITVSCQQDLESMIECNEKLPKLVIKESESDSQEEGGEQQQEEQKQEQQQEQKQEQQQQQQGNPCDFLGNLLNMSESFMKKCGEFKQGPQQKGNGCEFYQKMAEQLGGFAPQFCEEMAKEFSKECNQQQQQGQQGAQFFQNFAQQMNNLTPQFEEMAQQFSNPEFFSAAFMPQQQQQQSQQPQQQQQEQKEEQVNEKDDEEEIDQFLSKGPKEKVLKEFDEEVLLKACSVSEVLGGEINDYLGVCEAYRERDLDYVIERLTIDPQLTEKFSSYK